MLAAAAAYDAAEDAAPGAALRAVIASCMAEEITLEELMGTILSNFQITAGCADSAGSTRRPKLRSLCFVHTPAGPHNTDKISDTDRVQVSVRWIPHHCGWLCHVCMQAGLSRSRPLLCTLWDADYVVSLPWPAADGGVPTL